MTSFDRNRDSVGLAVLDDDHQRLDLFVSALVDAVRRRNLAQARSCTSELVERFAAHFEAEQRLMAESGFKDLERHTEAHLAFLGDARRFAQELESKGASSAFERWALGRLPAWVQHHVVTNDAALGRHLASRAPAGLATPGPPDLRRR